MIKKLSILIISAVLSLPLMAQVAVGNWMMHSPFSGVEKMVETESYVYYLSAGSVYSIDKATTEVKSLSSSGALNDIDATGIFRARDGKSVIVAYSSGNIDRLYDSGRTVNLPDIKDATSLSGTRNINDIAFGKENFYVATSFGLITYRDKRNEVSETVFTPAEVQLVGVNNKYVAVKTGNQIKFALQSEKINAPSKLRLLDSYNKSVNWTALEGVDDDNNFMLVSPDNSSAQLHILTVDLDAATASDRRIQNTASQFISNISKQVGSCNGNPYAVNSEGIYTVEPEAVITFTPIPREKAKTEFLTYNGSVASVWEGNESGVRNFNWTDPSAPALRHDYITGTTLNTRSIHQMHVGESGNIYFADMAEHQTFGISATGAKKSSVGMLTSSGFADISGVDVDRRSNSNPSKTAPYFVNNAMRLCEDPSDPGAYYIGTLFEGCYRIKNGKQTHQFSLHNSPIPTQYGAWANNVSQPLVDLNGNLWLYTFSDTKDGDRLFALPASRRMAGDVTAADWKTFPTGTFIDQDKRDGFGILCHKTGHLVFAPGRWSNYLMIVDTKGTATLSDDRVTVVNNYYDQDGKQLAFSHITCLAEDNEGRLWVGTEAGLFEIPDLDRVVSDPVTVNHMKVPRNDGTNLADYLLDATLVSSIAVDSANRKWISTIGSGVYLVSPRGDEIIANYTSANSILPNTVYAVACDPASNRVFFGLSSGLAEYSSTSSPAADDYSDVYAYPNPVRPDFTGWITVTGLMENSLVKIADSAGNLVHQGKSDGGMFTWDGCNLSGQRVSSGVYYVFASQNASGSNSACVTKIMVIN